ncbi:MAG TPA: hypothetical protein VII98_13970 [Solirubrobacteraceae bacterium]
MRGRAAILAVGVLAAVLAAPSAQARRHRLLLPGAELAHALTVDESEWTMRGSKTVVAAGVVRIRAYNRGEDDHNVMLFEQDGTPDVVSLKPGDAGTITAHLRPGTYKLFCSLFAGTPDSHEDKGMRLTLTVR